MLIQWIGLKLRPTTHHHPPPPPKTPAGDLPTCTPATSTLYNCQRSKTIATQHNYSLHSVYTLYLLIWWCLMVIHNPAIVNYDVVLNRYWEKYVSNTFSLRYATVKARYELTFSFLIYGNFLSFTFMIVNIDNITSRRLH